MAAPDWSKCHAVESVPGKVSGAQVFKDTRAYLPEVPVDCRGATTRIYGGSPIAIRTWH